MPEITDRYKVKSLGVFGSYVRGEAKKSSDLDILVEFDRAPSLLEFIRMEDDLSDKVGIKVDLVMKKALKPQHRFANPGRSDSRMKKAVRDNRDFLEDMLQYADKGMRIVNELERRLSIYHQQSETNIPKSHGAD